MKDTIFIDLDDTMANFMKSYRIGLHNEPGIIYPQSQLKFFENLEPVDGAIEAWWKLKTKYNTFALSKPSVYNPLSYTEKRLWFEKHLGFKECERLILSCDKTLLRGKFLIDDAAQDGLLIPEWEQIVFGSVKFSNWEAVLNYLM